MARKPAALEIEENPQLERMEWYFERVGFAVLLVIALAGAAGLFGTGPLSRATATSPAGKLQATYERFLRADLVSELTVTARAPGEPLWIEVDGADLAALAQVKPAPRALRRIGDRWRLVFSESAGGVVLLVHPRAAGKLQTYAGIGEGEQLVVNQWVYP